MSPWYAAGMGLLLGLVAHVLVNRFAPHEQPTTHFVADNGRAWVGDNEPYNRVLTLPMVPQVTWSNDIVCTVDTDKSLRCKCKRVGSDVAEEPINRVFPSCFVGDNLICPVCCQKGGD